MKNTVKRLYSVVLAIFAVALISSGSPERLVIYDSCDYLEINNIYKIDNETGEIKPTIVQYIWWEWRDSILVPVLDPNTRQKTGLSKQSSGFVVRDYVVVKNNNLKQPQIIHTALAKTKRGWVCIYQDFTRDITRHVSVKWIVITHTSYDSELNNREIIALENRNRLTRR